MATPALAETSSWTSTTEAPDAPVPKKAPGPAKMQKGEPPKKVPTTIAPKQPAAATGTSTVTKTPAPAGDDAAYEAFDQGKYLTALELGLKAAAKGDAQAHTLVGRIYQDGLGTSKNLAAAAQWYARGAELGDAEAMFSVAVMLAEGQGVQKDRTEGVFRPK